LNRGKLEPKIRRTFGSMGIKPDFRINLTCLYILVKEKIKFFTFFTKFRYSAASGEQRKSAECGALKRADWKRKGLNAEAGGSGFRASFAGTIDLGEIHKKAGFWLLENFLPGVKLTLNKVFKQAGSI
jgi:hypothetical protein